MLFYVGKYHADTLFSILSWMEGVIVMEEKIGFFVHSYSEDFHMLFKSSEEKYSYSFQVNQAFLEDRQRIRKAWEFYPTDFPGLCVETHKHNQKVLQDVGRYRMLKKFL